MICENNIKTHSRQGYAEANQIGNKRDIIILRKIKPIQRESKIFKKKCMIN
jgi:hypothetical protein